MNSIVNSHYSLFLPINFLVVLPCDLNSCLIHLDTCTGVFIWYVKFPYSAKLCVNNDLI